MDERAEFWSKFDEFLFTKELKKYGAEYAAFSIWQAATQRQQERIAALEAQVAALKPKADHFEETVAMWSHAYNNALHEADAHRRMRLEAEAQVQALSLDAERYRFLRDEAEQFDFPVPLVHITDRHGRVEIDEEGFAPFVSDMKLDKTIDDAIARATHKEQKCSAG